MFYTRAFSRCYWLFTRRSTKPSRDDGQGERGKSSPPPLLTVPGPKRSAKSRPQTRRTFPRHGTAAREFPIRENGMWFPKQRENFPSFFLSPTIVDKVFEKTRPGKWGKKIRFSGSSFYHFRMVITKKYTGIRICGNEQGRISLSAHRFRYGKAFFVRNTTGY